MKGSCVTVFRGGEFIHEEIYLNIEKQHAAKHLKIKHPEFCNGEYKIVANDYDTEECKMHFDACKKYGLVF